MFRRLQMWMILSLIAAAVPVQAQQAASDKPPAAQAAAADSNAAAQKAATQDPNYIIGAQDVLDVSVWKEQDVSRVVPVRPDGKISLPLLNDVQAAGLTPSQLAAQITVALKKYVTSPQVTVIVTTINSQRIYIIGEVARPGAFPMLPGMNVLQGLSSAGGFTQFAKTKGIYVLRMEDGKQQKYPVNYKEVVSGKHPEQDILLKAGDTIVVP
ncbi:MAG TPA: polysaccharide biosynthesis/export family protein [Candidatus Acidoferrales bacterium]|jgi:polysaccharide export outer membrane protein|nr:polysaccharide biosynthesis/export family protein [Candidatus Acidoferrales bacterium]